MWRAMLAQFEVHDRRLFWGVLSLVIFSLVAYVYFLSVSIYGVIARKHAESEISVLSAKVSMLESRYAVLDKAINLELAHSRGFVDISVPKYISREVVRETLTLRDREGL
jgi:hypothetical protein